MGAAHSRARPGCGPTKIRSKLGSSGALAAVGAGNHKGNGYFILCIKSNDRIKVVNASNTVIKLVTAIVKRHCNILRSGWDRHSSYFFKLQAANRHSLILLTAEVLLSLYRAGWEPMTPIDLSVKGKGNQTAICFRRESPEDVDVITSTSMADVNQENKECLCIETYGKNLLGFHDVPNTVLHDLVTCVRVEWNPGIIGISNAVSSVISDYSVGMNYAVLPGDIIDDRRYIKLRGRPWSAAAGEEDGPDLRDDENGEVDDDAFCAENLVIGICACLARAQYKLQISIQMDMTTTVFFFIRDTSSREIRLPTFCGVGLGEKNGMYVYKPTITRTKTSFFRSRNRDRGEAVSGAAAVGSGGSGISKGKSFRKRIRASFRMKSMREKKKSVTATPNAPELNAGAAADTNPTGKKPMVLKDKRIRNLLTVAADSDTDTETEADS